MIHVLWFWKKCLISWKNMLKTYWKQQHLLHRILTCLGLFLLSLIFKEFRLLLRMFRNVFFSPWLCNVYIVAINILGLHQISKKYLKSITNHFSIILHHIPFQECHKNSFFTNLKKSLSVDNWVKNQWKTFLLFSFDIQENTFK